MALSHGSAAESRAASIIGWLTSWKYPGAVTIVFATTLHLIEGVVLLTTTSANKSTPIAALLNNLPQLPGLTSEESVAAMLFTAALAAMISIHNRRLNHWLAAALLVPQQTLLATTCYGALIETFHGTYADGYHAPVAFILCDQLTRILVAPAYTAAIFLRALWSPDNGGVALRRVKGE